MSIPTGNTGTPNFYSMRTFEDCFSKKEILKQICKIRVKIAKNNSKKHLFQRLISINNSNKPKEQKKEQLSDLKKYQAKLIKDLFTILPPRKKWITLGEKSRRKSTTNNEQLTTIDKNFYSLLKTIKVHEKKNSQEKWFIELQKFITEIKDLSKNNSYIVETPIIIPQPKDKQKKKDDKIKYRPICLFNLKDRIILSLTNKFFTNLFDKYFEDSSFAFRAKKNNENKTLSHHDCIKKILEYVNNNKDKNLYVVECDMQNFYDTVNHKIIRQLFYELISIENKSDSELNIVNAIHIFESYLNCFAFNTDILKLNDDVKYWKDNEINNGCYAWIKEKSLNRCYEDITNERVGVPQGGALSGLIANIFLNQADLKMKKKENVLYLRFCDDMIIISNDLEECKKAKNIYQRSLNKLKLFAHRFKSNQKKLLSICDEKKDYKPFWKGKSKGPYQWGKIENNCFPWIGFVGYEINYLGDVRVRKNSLEKEIKKQKKIKSEIKKAIKNKMIKSKNTVKESLINRLVGMSVGRINLYNFREVSNDLCWKNGFTELTINKYSKKQIKQLDRNRNYLINKFKKEIENHDCCSDNKKIKNKRKIINYNKPFSYYYQVLERKKKHQF